MYRIGHHFHQNVVEHVRTQQELRDFDDDAGSNVVESEDDDQDSSDDENDIIHQEEQKLKNVSKIATQTVSNMIESCRRILGIKAPDPDYIDPAIKCPGNKYRVFNHFLKFEKRKRNLFLLCIKL